jgi:hypothetical protein
MSIPEKVKKNANSGLALYKENKIGGTSVSLANARFLSKEASITPAKIRHMYKAINSSKKKDIVKSPPNEEYIKMMLYGGKESVAWISDLYSKIEEADNKMVSYFGEEITFPYKSIKDAPANIQELDGVPLTASQASEIAAQADSVSGEYAWPTAIKSWKSRHIVKDGKWIKKEDSKQVEESAFNGVEETQSKLGLSEPKKEEYSLKIKKTEEIKKAEVKFSLTSSQITEILSNSLSEFVYGKDSWRKYWVYSFDEEYAYVRDSQDEKQYRMKYSISDLVATIDMESKEEVIQGSPIPVQKEEYTPEFEEEFAKEPESKEEDSKEKEEEPEDKEVKEKFEEGEKEEAPEEKDDEEESDGGKKKEKEVEMSNDMNLDIAAFLAMLEDDTEEFKQIVEKHKNGEELDYCLLCKMAHGKITKMAEESKEAQKDKDAYMSENEALKKFKEDTEKSKFAFEVESTITEVTDSLPKDKVDEIREDSKNFTLESLDGWKNKVKAIAFEFSKDKKQDDGINRIHMSSWTEEKNTANYSKGWIHQS